MKMKKFAALAAATVMSVSAIAATSAFGVFATTDAGVNNIVIKDSDTNRVYKAYQIFDQASATNTIKWGKGINGDALLTSLKTSGLSTYMSQFDSAESAVDVAKIISDADHWTKEDTAKFAKAASACIIDNKSVTAYEDNGEYTIPLPNAGYYLVVDATENNGVDKANSALILNVSGTTNVTPKKTKPTLTKQIKHNENDSWGDVGDNAIGDDVEFKITTTIPSDVSAYDKYTYTVRDQLSEGLTFNNNLTYKYYDASGNEITPVTVGPNTTVGVDDPSTADFKETFYVTFDIKELLKKYPNVDKIETLYSAKLNENANVVTGTLPNSKDNNPNTAYLTYSNNPQDTTGKEKGETPKVTVYDWTFSLVGNKVDEKGEPLADAKFQLQDKNGAVLKLVDISDGENKNVYRLAIGNEAGAIDTIITDATGKFTIKGIDDQTTYKLVETEAPAQYNRADPYEFKFDTTYDPANTLQSIRMLDGTDSGTSGSTVKIINQKGGSLPTTGGIGTQIFYGVGGAIVLGAGVLLIAKKRAKNDLIFEFILPLSCRSRSAGIREDSMRKKSGKSTTILLVLLLLVGLSVMLYPTISDWWNSKTQSRAVATYQKAANDLSDKENEEILSRARKYNEEIAKLARPFVDYDQVKGYEDILDITGTGVMGYISIPTIRVELPIYHGTSDGVLNVAVGHLQGSSLPVGGADTHSVISAHRGLPSAKLFSDLDKLAEGDEFTITVLKEVYTYEVESVYIVLPNEMDKLNIIPGEDHVTLTTCTPYGVNSHRLLVRAKRVETADDTKSVSKITADAVQLDSLVVVPFVAIPLFVVLLVWWFVDSKRKKSLMMSLWQC